MTVRRALLGAAFAAAIVAVQPGAAAAAPVLANDPPSADAACLINASGVMTCFSTAAAMQTQASAGPETTCPLFLYSGADYTGRLLQIDAQGYWLNLSDYDFADTTVAFAGTGCGFHLAQYDYGGGYWYPGNTGPWALCPNMGAGWDDAVASVYVD